ncbi:acyl-CoA reductase-like NAD-dependent aldehyde dehydrogenase [Paenibacillus rhizosphaerae]|uniref:Acyl-CoA reductase-like NAD-dependent aldehyde dehydrogenase n=1 Tax=Paenibacillus rhizosphaerae TaxID=297318 RepID=A0A839TWV4_9BACL|nr:aldehyde dehydrogenase family protein [Paenibacillus rhizosphaerae]MBB3129147.1 acyl-CoA reductase-like NAD-dependent aldehyde dehydrogenase [Paenibacillus rhizosphaerae]
MSGRKKLFIDGRWVEAQYYETLKSPYSEETIAEIPQATIEETESAIAAADRAAKVMAVMSSHQRAEILGKVTLLLTERAEEAARLIAAEAAKPLAMARAEVQRTIMTYKFSSEEARRIQGEQISVDAAPGGENRTAYTVREPLGTVGAITPFNFPMNLVAHKVGPAIAAGNSVVLKPASQTPLSSFFVAELFAEAGLPAGALNVVTGSGRKVGDKIVTDPRIKAVTFTGSPEVGMEIRSRAGLKRATLELGSNSALIVDRDVDIDEIIDRCVTSSFSFQGQVCISLQRIYVHEAIYDMFVNKFLETTHKLTIGDPLDERTDLSALISRKDVERTLSWIEEAKQNGAVIATGGTAERNIVLPTVLLEVDSKTKVSCQEAFAPVVLINKVKSVEEAVNYVNDSRFGLQAGIYTSNMHNAFSSAKTLHVGGVMLNDTPSFRLDHMPYGGVKDSGMGREGIKYAVEELTEMKLVVINHNITHARQ